ncbi:hypothetical protein D3C78_1736580 [compost metagenome]
MGSKHGVHPLHLLSAPAPERCVMALCRAPSLIAQSLNSSGEAEGQAVLPCFSSRALTSGSRSTCALASNSFLMTSGGSLAGP